MLHCICVARQPDIWHLHLTGTERERRVGAQDPKDSERNGRRHELGPGSEGSRVGAGKQWSLFGGEAARFRQAGAGAA